MNSYSRMQTNFRSSLVADYIIWIYKAGEVNSKLFTIHRPFTVYLNENKGKKTKVNSVNSFS